MVMAREFFFCNGDRFGFEFFKTAKDLKNHNAYSNLITTYNHTLSSPTQMNLETPLHFLSFIVVSHCQDLTPLIKDYILLFHIQDTT